MPVPVGDNSSIYSLLSSLLSPFHRWEKPRFKGFMGQGRRISYHIHNQILFYVYRFVLVCFVFYCSYPQQVGVKTLRRCTGNTALS